MNYIRTHNFGFAVPGIPRAVRTLILLNVGVFFIQVILNKFLPEVTLSLVTGGSPLQDFGRAVAIKRFDSWFALVPHWVITQARIWQLFTYMFLHGNFFHIFINMLMLWFFGAELERYWGARQFVKFYFICGMGAGLFHMLFSFNSIIPVIGASGAVYGVLAAFALLFPDRIITLLLFFIFPIQLKVKYLAMIAIASSVLGGFAHLFGDQSGIAHLAHLGGMLVGYLLLRRGAPFARLRQYGQKMMRRWTVAAEAKRNAEVQRLRGEVDSLLDKINEVGYENLTAKEKKLLKDASRFLSQE